MRIAYFVGDVPDRGPGVAIRFAYDLDTVANLKQALRVARSHHKSRTGQWATQWGGWVPTVKVWFCPVEFWAVTALQMQRQGHQLEAIFDESVFYARDFVFEEDNFQQPGLRHDRTADWSLFSLSPGTSAVDLKRAYRDLIDVWHPDRFAHNPRLQAKAEAMTKRINAAYQRLQVAA